MQLFELTKTEQNQVEKIANLLLTSTHIAKVKNKGRLLVIIEKATGEQIAAFNHCDYLHSKSMTDNSDFWEALRWLLPTLCNSRLVLNDINRSNKEFCGDQNYIDVHDHETGKVKTLKVHNNIWLACQP